MPCEQMFEQYCRYRDLEQQSGIPFYNEVSFSKHKTKFNGATHLSYSPINYGPIKKKTPFPGCSRCLPLSVFGQIMQ